MKSEVSGSSDADFDQNPTKTLKRKGIDKNKSVVRHKIILGGG
jgi:hypothetical protein